MIQRAHSTSDTVGVHRYTKNTYGVDCACGWSVTITTKSTYATTEAHAHAWAAAHRAGQDRPAKPATYEQRVEEVRAENRWLNTRTTGPCPCECNRGGFCGGCGHAGCGRR